MRRSAAVNQTTTPEPECRRTDNRWAGTVLLAAAGGVMAAIGTQARLPEAGAIHFTAAQMGTPLQGAFEEFTSQVEFDPDHPDKGAVHVRVNVASVNAGSREANDLLRSAGFFDAGHFAQATFDASGFAAQAGGHYVANGTFTLKGHALSLPVTFTATAGAPGRWIDGSFSVSRLEFGVGQGEWSDTSTLDDKVEIAFHILQEKVPHQG